MFMFGMTNRPAVAYAKMLTSLQTYLYPDLRMVRGLSKSARGNTKGMPLVTVWIFMVDGLVLGCGDT